MYIVEDSEDLTVSSCSPLKKEDHALDIFRTPVCELPSAATVNEERSLMQKTANPQETAKGTYLPLRKRRFGLHHPFFFFFFLTKKDCIILEHGIPDLLKREIDVHQLQLYGYCMFKALASLHKQGVVHRDVKTGKFLFL